ncbi:MAG: YgiQ family radical SAM protein [Prevotellaceae bacterium]|nr:YgiQ family radical SAM protein [Prevotellaceae bacterium]
MDYKLTDWLPTTRREMELRGWDVADVIIFSADAYVDHPSFGAAVISRLIEAEGFRVCVVPQPDWHGDFRDFRKLGRPRLFFSVAPGAMDSMVNKYTAARRLRSEDAYSPDGRHDLRPDYPTVVYTQILKQLYPDAPVVLGGIEASLRRVTHYDYWQEKLRPSIICDAGADLLVYGMGELPTAELCRLVERKLCHGRDDSFASASDFRQLLRKYPVRQTVTLERREDICGGIRPDDIMLNAHETCLHDKKAYAANFRHIEEESNKLHPQRILQETGGKFIVVNPPFPPMTTEQIDRSFDFPYTRLPHPKYKGKRISAYEMIKFSVNIHRGCFGGCAFCTISAHQGKFIMSRSKENILREVRKITQMPDFRGYLSDLGGPSANMYMMGGKDRGLCRKCKRPSCIFPRICPNLSNDHRPLLDIYAAVDAMPGIKKSFIGSGIRYDMLLHRTGDAATDKGTELYTRELIVRHVSGRLKVAPEHTSDRVLQQMRKPSFVQFRQFKKIFDRINREAGLNQQIIPYFISSHPGCTSEDMAELAAETRDMDFRLEQVQDFTPTPMTVATETWYSGYHPYTLEPMFSAQSPREKSAQRQFFFWYKQEEQQKIMAELRRIGRLDLIERLYGVAPQARKSQEKRKNDSRKEERKAVRNSRSKRK